VAKRRANETERRDSMSKQKIDETMTEARIARTKRARKAESTEPPGEVQVEAPPETGEAPARRRKTRPLTVVPDEKPEAEPKEDLVVFAFRLKVHERDLIHKAAGAAKASRFVRALTVAAAMGDEETVVEIVRAAKEEMAATS
jgi:hypothetical protein